MEAVLSRLQTLSPEALREEIKRAGLKCGPITATTRGLFEKKLARTLLEIKASDCTTSDVAIGEPGAAACCSEQEEFPVAYPEVTKLEVDGASSSGQALEHASQQTSPESPSRFYGVLTPPDDPLLNDGSLHVYTDKQKALKAVTKMKGARFKAFSNREDAERFAKGICDGGLSPQTHSADKPHTSSPAEKSLDLEMANVEKANEFKSPRTQDLTAKLRRAVEHGDEEAFRELVWSNPRYLIGSGDNPTIVQEGCRYNVLHVAAKENQAGMAQLILDILDSPEFMRLMYPADRQDMLLQRIAYIVDLYLNTPDKVSNETPLHFACKFGCPDVVNVLCSHPAIDKNVRNKYGQKPSSVICERKNKNKEVKEKIREHLEDRFFIPLLRATDNTLNPVVGTPWAPGSYQCGELSLTPKPTKDSMTVRALVGPLNLQKADDFYRLWKTPPRDRARYFHDILKSDSDRGAERVGRELAHEMRYPWAENWDFLNCFTDLATEDGLRMLENFLNSIGQQKNAIDKDWMYLKPPASLTGQEKGSSSNSSSNSLNFPVCNLLHEFERVSFDQTSADTADSTVDSGLGFLTLPGSGEGDDLCAADRSSLRGSEWTQTEENDSGSEEYYTADEDTEEDGHERSLFSVGGTLAQTIPWSHGERGRSNSESTCSSYKSTCSVPEEGRPTEGFWQNVFLAEALPTKLDSDVLLALMGTEIDEQLYPCVTKWRNSVLSYPESQRQRYSFP
ncbi:ankyrin repeat and LEM domain-containing protein 2 [Brachyhypopomus gauderio]|uniref:ankyrin repeat and LEM domain-containing protein 2 n=1 Tax=Brachyhypopomus gauderio TaxID=698409 RepID=UPI004043682C